MNKTLPFTPESLRADADVRLICLPFAGGSAVTYRSWLDLFAAPDNSMGIDVLPIELPGRGSRFVEPAIDEMGKLVECLRSGLELSFCKEQPKPLAFFGASMGARIAFELARAMQNDHHIAHVFAAASPSPRSESEKPIAHLTDEALREELRKFGGTPPDILADDELVELVFPALRADLRLVEAYRCEATRETKVSCPLTAFAGALDEDLTLDEVDDWSAFTHKTFRRVVVADGHFFLETARALLRDEIVQDLGLALLAQQGRPFACAKALARSRRA